MNERILVVDDEASIVEGLQNILERAGYYVKTANDGEEALGIIKKDTFDIVFTDLCMPKMDGIELCKELKEVSPDSIAILFTGNVHEGIVDKEIEFMEAGGKIHYLYKPMFPSELLESVGKVIAERAIA